MQLRITSRLALAAVCACFTASVSNAGSLSSCSYNGIALYGKVKFVDSFANLKIQFVNSFADLKVKFVNSFPDECGKWQRVDSFPDFTVQIVSSFPDLKVQEVGSFPGL